MISKPPAPTLRTTDDPNTSRLRVSTSTRSEFQIINGDYFIGSSVRTAVPVNDTHYVSVISPADKYLIIEDAITNINFSSVTDGKYTIEIDGYINGSPQNSYTTTPDNPLPVGIPLQTEAVKNPANYASSTADFSVTVSGLTGTADYPLLFRDYQIDVSGNRESISTVGATFFDKGRQIVLPPNNELLVRTITTGDATGGADIRLVFFTSEIPESQAPVLLGVNP